MVAVAVGWFQIPLRGSLLLLLAMSAIYVFSTLALGLFISTISDTQQQAMMTSTFFFLTPMLYLSGFIFPIENMPRAIQPVTYLIPLRYFLVIVRGIFLKGIGLELLWPQALAMSAWGLGMLGLAVARSRKRRWPVNPKLDIAPDPSHANGQRPNVRNRVAGRVLEVGSDASCGALQSVVKRCLGLGIGSFAGTWSLD